MAGSNKGNRVCKTTEEKAFLKIRTEIKNDDDLASLTYTPKCDTKKPEQIRRMNRLIKLLMYSGAKQGAVKNGLCPDTVRFEDITNAKIDGVIYRKSDGLMIGSEIKSQECSGNVYERLAKYMALDRAGVYLGLWELSESPFVAIVMGELATNPSYYNNILSYGLMVSKVDMITPEWIHSTIDKCGVTFEDIDKIEKMISDKWGGVVSREKSVEDVCE